MKKIIGYLIAGFGLLGMFAVSIAGKKFLPFLTKFPREFVLIPSLILVVLGVVILIVLGNDSSFGKIKQSEKEVPIYRGEGKKRKIVGYKVES